MSCWIEQNRHRYSIYTANHKMGVTMKDVSPRLYEVQVSLYQIRKEVRELC
jgi:hypothetical protein